jgi:hypothetical protein
MVRKKRKVSISKIVAQGKPRKNLLLLQCPNPPAINLSTAVGKQKRRSSARSPDAIAFVVRLTNFAKRLDCGRFTAAFARLEIHKFSQICRPQKARQG